MAATEGDSPRKYLRGGRAGVLLALMLPASAPTRLPAQVLPNRATLYLHPTDVADARALWVNPAGVAVLHQASVHLELTVRDPGPDGRLRQLTAGFGSRGLGFSYQRDALDGGPVAHTYRVGLAGAAGGLAAGLAVAHYRGGANATGWHVGVVYARSPAVTLGAVVDNLSQPEVRSVKLPLTVVPGITIAPLGPYLILSTHASLTRDSVLGYTFGARWTWRTRVPVTLLARLDTDRALRRAGLAFGLAVGGQDVVGVVASTPGDLRAVDAVSLYGVSSRPLER